MWQATVRVLLAGAVAIPSHSLTAQFDSTAMPSLESLAMEAGRASRRHPVRAVSQTLLCEVGHPLVDSASLAACTALITTRAPAITAAFARGIEMPLSTATEGDSTVAV